MFNRTSSKVLEDQTGQFEDSDFDLSRYLWMLKRRRLVVMGVAAATFSLICAYNLLVKPTYQSEMLLLLEDKSSQPEILSDAAPLSGISTGAPDFTTQINTQIQVLSARPLLNKALHTMRSKYSELKDSEVDDLIRDLDIEQITRTQVVSVSYKSTNRELARDMLNDLSQIYIKYSLDIQRSKVGGAITFIEGEVPNVRHAVEQAEEELKRFRRQFNVLDPQEQGSELFKSMNTIYENLEQAQVEYKASEEQYSSLQNRLGVQPGQALASVALSEDASYQAGLKQLQELEAQLAIEQARFRDDYPTVQNLKVKRNNLRTLLDRQSRQILGNRSDPAIISGGSSLQDSLASNPKASLSSKGISDRLGELRLTLAGDLLKAENNRRVQAARVAGLQEAKNRMVEQFKIVPALAKRYEELRRNAVIASNSLNKLLERLQELRIQAAQELSPWRVIEPAPLPEKPVWPKTVPLLGGGIFVSILFGLGAASLLEAIDDRIKSIDQAKEFLQLPLLGAIPYTDELTVPVLRPSPKQGEQTTPASFELENYIRSASREAFRSLMTNLRFLSSDRKMKVFITTSSMAGEGKSTVSSNLAIVAGGLNRRVLLVDADLRRPTISKKLELSNGPGLSSVLSGEVNWKKALQKLDEKVHVLTSGPIPPDPVALIDSAKMLELINEWREEYDLVLIDSPPLIGIADATILAKYADGILIVLKLDMARQSSLKGAADRLRSVAINPVGMVVNGVRAESEGQYYYNQYYYHYYGEPVPVTDGNKRPHSKANKSKPLGTPKVGPPGFFNNFFSKKK